jgi:hypothetical protein
MSRSRSLELRVYRRIRVVTYGQIEGRVAAVLRSPTCQIPLKCQQMQSAERRTRG